MPSSSAQATGTSQTAPPRYRLLAATLSSILFICVFTVPYHVPVTPTFSISYMTGFNNHVAVALFVCAASLFAYAASGLSTTQDTLDHPLSHWVLWAALLFAGLCLLAVLHQHGSAGGNESPYQLERQSHLDAGQTLYRQFEFIYGPLLLYPGHWFHTILHGTTQTSYRFTWALEWLAGTAMLWFVVAKTAIPTRHRLLIFLSLLLIHITALPSEGVNQTLLRSFCAPFLSVAVYLVWQRSHHAYGTAAAAAAAIALGFAISPEQGLALAFGLSAYSLLLAWRDPQRFPLQAVLLIVLAAAAIFVTAAHIGELNTSRSMASGGYSFPLLPSLLQFATLAVYLSGFLVLYRALADRKTDTAILPLGLCGLPLLVSAFGRCDSGHLLSATPLYLLGLFGLARWPRLIWSYALLMAYFFIAPTIVRHAKMAAAGIGPYGTGTSVATAQIDPALTYFAPLAVPLSEDGQLLWHADSGYYFGVWNVTTPATFQAKADEIERRHAPLLLLPETGQPLRFPLWQTDTSPAPLHALERSYWVPRTVNTPLDGAQIIATIERLYEPTRQQQDGWRVWKLRSTAR